MWNLPNSRAGHVQLGADLRGAWNDPGHDLLRLSGSTYTTQPDIAYYDQMKIDYASRL